MTFTYDNQKNINLILTTLAITGCLFFQNSIVSYKLVYILQILIIFFFYFQFSIIKIDKSILLLNLIILSSLFFQFDKTFIYLFLICFLNIFSNFKNLNKIEIKKNLYFLNVSVLIIFFLLKTKFTFPDLTTTDLYAFENLLHNFSLFNNCMKDDPTYGLNCEWNIKSYRYGILNLHANLTSILCMLIIYIFTKNYEKKIFLKYFTIYSFLILFFTLSKSGLIFYLILTFLTIFNFNRKIIFLSFFLVNLLISITSYQFSAKFNNQWKEVHLEFVDVYQDQFCKEVRNIPIVNYFNECKFEKSTLTDKIDENSIYMLLNFFGYSSFYKFQSYGMIVHNILDNFKYYLMPNPLYYMEKDNIITSDNIKGELSAHSLFFLIFIKYGLVLGIIFCLNLYIFFKKNNDKKLFVAFIFSSTFLSIDIFLIFPIYLLSLFIHSGYKE